MPDPEKKKARSHLNDACVSLALFQAPSVTLCPSASPAKEKIFDPSPMLLDYFCLRVHHRSCVRLEIGNLASWPPLSRRYYYLAFWVGSSAIFSHNIQASLQILLLHVLVRAAEDWFQWLLAGSGLFLFNINLVIIDPQHHRIATSFQRYGALGRVGWRGIDKAEKGEQRKREVIWQRLVPPLRHLQDELPRRGKRRIKFKPRRKNNKNCNTRLFVRLCEL